MKNLSEVLKEFNLDPLEISIYQYIVDLKTTTAYELSQLVRIPRTTMYYKLKQLEEKRLISKYVKSYKTYFTTESIEEFIRNQSLEINDMERELMQRKKAVKNLEKNKSLIKTNEKHIVTTYLGKQEFIKLANRSLNYSKKEILFLSDFAEWTKIYSEKYDDEYYVKQRVKKGIFLFMLANKSEYLIRKETESRGKNLMRTTRFLPEDKKINTTFILYDNELSVMLTGEPPIAINIRNKDIADDFRKIYFTLWELSTPAEKLI